MDIGKLRPPSFETYVAFVPYFCHTQNVFVDTSNAIRKKLSILVEKKTAVPGTTFAEIAAAEVVQLGLALELTQGTSSIPSKR